MAARPIERYVLKQIKEQGGWERILERLASGETVTDVARTLLRPDGQPISRNLLSMLLHRDPERSQAVFKARDEGSDAMVDEAVSIVDRAPVDRDGTNHAKVRAEMRLKVAGLINRERWGEAKPSISVQVNTAELHLDALRQRMVAASKPLATALESQRLESQRLESQRLLKGSAEESVTVTTLARGRQCRYSNDSKNKGPEVTVEREPDPNVA